MRFWDWGTDWILVGPDRQALRYCIRNQTLPARTRAEAQLQLTQMHCYTRPTQIRNRCILGGKGRGVLRDFKMTRVGFLDPKRGDEEVEDANVEG
jgi:ribosomal protein S14